MPAPFVPEGVALGALRLRAGSGAVRLKLTKQPGRRDVGAAHRSAINRNLLAESPAPSDDGSRRLRCVPVVGREIRRNSGKNYARTTIASGVSTR